MTNPYLQKISELETTVADAIKLLRKAATLYDAAIGLQNEGAEEPSASSFPANELLFAGGKTETVKVGPGQFQEMTQGQALQFKMNVQQEIINDPLASADKKFAARQSMMALKGHLTRLQKAQSKAGITKKAGTRWSNAK